MDTAQSRCLKTDDDMKIGIFDSGLGGLSILSILQQKFNHNFLYLADSKNAPYGSKNETEIAGLTFDAVMALFNLGANFVIVACNTASSVLALLEQSFPQHKVLGIIEPTLAALQTLPVKHLGVLATQQTVRSGAYEHLAHINVYQRACPTWAGLVEEGISSSHIEIQQDIQKLLSVAPDISHLLLGCTHYPWLLSAIQKCVPVHVQILAQGDFVAEALAKLTEQVPGTITQSTCQFFTTGSPDVFAQRASQLLGYAISCQYLALTTEKTTT